MSSRHGARRAIRGIGGLWLAVGVLVAGPIGCTSGGDGKTEVDAETGVGDGTDVLEFRDPPDPFLEQAQQWVDDCRALYKGLKVPDSLMQDKNGPPTKTADAFDPNLFFTVLDKLQMEEGWVLDYTYFYAWDTGGEPTLVARDARSPLCLSDPENPCVFEPVKSHLIAEPTKEGLTQLWIFRTVGNQFYQYWHMYADSRPVFTEAGLQRWRKETRDGLTSEAMEGFDTQTASLRVDAHIDFDTDTLHVKAAEVGGNAAPVSISVLISSEPPYEYSAGPDPDGDMCECNWCGVF